jgi:hypothetical protein
VSNKLLRRFRAAVRRAGRLEQFGKAKSGCHDHDLAILAHSCSHLIYLTFFMPGGGRPNGRRRAVVIAGPVPAEFRPPDPPLSVAARNQKLGLGPGARGHSQFRGNLLFSINYSR